jgi:hypothetical protein
MPAPAGSPPTWRYAAIIAIAVTAFLSSYAYATSRAASSAVGAAARAGGGPIAAAASGVSGSGCACCGSSSGLTVPGQATRAGDVQRIVVGTSSGTWSPNEIHVKAGVPVEITFEEGQGCLAQVVLDEFDIVEDLTRGGAVVRLPALDPGRYGFRCGMSMALGTIVAK